MEFEEDVATLGQVLHQVVDGLAAGIAALVEQGADFFVEDLEAAGAFVQAVQPAADVGEEGAGFGDGVMFRELRGHGRIRWRRRQ